MDSATRTAWNPYHDEWSAVFAGEGESSTARLMARLGTGGAWERAQRGLSRSILREFLTAKYALGVPNERALAVVKGLGPVVEMGAGNGYWARCLRERGVDVVAYDEMGVEWSYLFSPRELVADESGEAYAVPVTGSDTLTWTEVLRGGPADLAAHGDRALLLVWPHMDSMAADCLDHYPGDHVVYVGEGWGGCTADDRFFELLEAGWDAVESFSVPQWDRVHDYLTVFRRRW